MKSYLVLSCCLSLSIKANCAVNFMKPAPIPQVDKITCRTDVEVRLDGSQTVVVKSHDAKAVGWVRRHMKEWFRVEPKVVAGGSSADTGAEGYRLAARPDGMMIEASTLQGVRYAMYTLRQVAERNSSGSILAYFRMPEFEIVDSPRLQFRGIHFCWMPELSATFIERQIRLAAYYKFNHVVIESWGVFKSERHPWFGWKDGPMTKSVIRHLREVADDVGVTLIPQINVWGHATASRSCAGKNAALDFSPERQPLFEPFGGSSGAMSSAWNWCLSNPDAVRTVRELVEEIHEAFGNPPYFHIGCDEADGPSCASCRAGDYSKLVADYITEICQMLEKRGTRAMMWHDMLLLHGDPRWKGFYANGDSKTAKLPTMLPKSIVICDWYYGSDPGGTANPARRKSNTGAYPTLEYFSRECGFDTLTCPWEEPGGMRAQMKYAADNGLFGVLETTWHHFGKLRYPSMIQTAACGAWGRGERLQTGNFATAWRQCGWDMGADSYKESGWYDDQVSRGIGER